jgi:hypothetical protein
MITSASGAEPVLLHAVVDAITPKSITAASISERILFDIFVSSNLYFKLKFSV